MSYIAIVLVTVVLIIGVVVISIGVGGICHYICKPVA